jgi:probable F420-dependent oxidoreductase
MRDYLLAVRAVWDSWQHQTRLNYQGEFYKLTLMTPFFSPAPHEYPRIPIFIAGVNRGMCELAGELCDGFHVHPLHTTRYLQEKILPNIATGLAKSGRTRSAIELSSSIFVIPTDDADQAVKYEADVRQQIAFYASTPPYRPVFEVEGWSDVADRLKALAARGQWSAMPPLINDEMLEGFALRGRWADLPALLRQRYAKLLDRVSYYFPLVPGEHEAGWRATAAALRQ